MFFGAAFILLAAAFTLAALTSGGSALCLLWPAVSCLLLAVAYLGAGVRVFGKRADGSLPALNTLLLLPFLLYARALWHLLRRVRREPPCHRVLPGIYAGRRVLARELPDDVETVVDLTAEFPEPAGVRLGRDYLCYPILDGAPPDDERAFLTLVGQALASRRPVYIHCAEGRGRTGTLVAALALASGASDDVAGAIEAARRARPGIRLRSSQRAFLERIRPSLRRLSGGA